MTPEEALEHLSAWTSALKDKIRQFASIRENAYAQVPDAVSAAAFGYDAFEAVITSNTRHILDQSINVEEERAAQYVLLLGGLLSQQNMSISPQEWAGHISNVKQLRQFPQTPGNVVKFPDATAILKAELSNAARLGGITEIIQPRDHEREKTARKLAVTWTAQLLVVHVLDVWKDALVTPSKSKATENDGLRWPYRLIGIAAGLS